MVSIRHVREIVAGIFLTLLALNAHAVPSFARQSGMDCTTCHFSWLELTNVGRRFKLGGYQLTKAMPDDAKRPVVSFNFQDLAPIIPLAGMIQASMTGTAKVNTPGTDPKNDFPYNKEVLLQQASVFLNGKLYDHIGCFCQITYDGASSHTSIDNFEIRFANEYHKGKFDALYGLSLNNSPTMSDIYNTTPVWGWPYAGTTVAPAPAASTVINGGLAQSVAGLSAYALIDKTVYVEFGGYHYANGVVSFLRAGTPTDGLSIVKGVAPYYRAALQHEWDKGHQTAMIGAFGLDTKKYPDTLNPFGPTDEFKDSGFDAQYQYVTDKHRFSAQFSYIHERQTLDGTLAGGGSTNLNNTLNQVNTKISYYFKKWYGISAGYQRTSGSTDPGIYDTGAALTGSINASPNSEAEIVELNYLFSMNGAQAFRKSRIVVQYTYYNKFNGGTTNYDGYGRNAKDNNTLYVLAWLMY